MKYLSVSEIARLWQISERSVRKYCNESRIPHAFMTGKTWNIPDNAVKPSRRARITPPASSLLQLLKREKDARLSGGVYHHIQIELTYNSNHIEGSRLSHEQTRYIFETNTIGISADTINVDDIVETSNHFRCIDMIIDYANRKLSEALIKELHKTLKSGTSDSRKAWFAVGEYKRLANEVGGHETCPPEEVAPRLKKLLRSYNAKASVTLEELLDFHYQFERIHPFQDGNGRIGRLLLFKECLRHGILPFIIEDNIKLYYYRGLNEWKKERGFLIGTCEAAQDNFKEFLKPFRLHF